MFGAQYFFTAAVVLAVVAGWLDWRTGHMPNPLTLVPLLGAPVAHAAVGYLRGGLGPAGTSFLFSVLGALACAIVPLILYYAGAIGGGDVKLLAAIGALCRASVGVECELYAFIAAALYAPGRLAYEGKLLSALGNTLMLALNPFLPKAKRRKIDPEMLTELRFGPSVAVGTLVGVLLAWRGP